ncbi:MAG: hypothetical protein J5802_05655 [Butyrivibrio sp.]|nr:hypothetical protein [Butyrivibrio sp.]
MRNASTKVLSAIMAIVLPICIFFTEVTSVRIYAADDPYTALSKATTVYNGVDYKAEYNPLYYYLNYADLRAAFGADPNKLVEHYATFGKKEKRVADRLIGDSTESIVPTGEKDVIIIPKTKHDNGGMTYDQEIQARNIAKQIAEAIDNAADAGNTSGSSKKSSKKKNIKDVEKVAYAAGIVKAYCDQGTYTTKGKIYRTAYGVFIGGEYSCAGATRALGLILDYLGISWVHKNINSWEDQWCQVIVDGKEGYGDGIYAMAGYGKHPNEGGEEKDAVSYAKIRYKFDVATEKPKLTR